MDINMLRGEISVKYKTQLAFGEAIQWHKNKVSKMMVGEYTPNVDEAASIAKALELTNEKYIDIFLS